MDNDLQFDRAEFAAPPAACKTCGSALQGVYYQANGMVLCGPCADHVRNYVSGPSATPNQLALAAGLGLGAAGLGSFGYYWVRELTDANWGIASIFLGMLVAKAVRHASGNRGGFPYQVLAAALTYLAIVGAFIPDLWPQLFTRSGAVDWSEVVAMLRIPIHMISISSLTALIYGFGIWEAWRRTAAIPLQLSGPHSLSHPPAQSASVANA